MPETLAPARRGPVMRAPTGHQEAIRVLTVAMQQTAAEAGPAFAILNSARGRLAMTDPERAALTGPDVTPVEAHEIAECPTHGGVAMTTGQTEAIRRHRHLPYSHYPGIGFRCRCGAVDATGTGLWISTGTAGCTVCAAPTTRADGLCGWHAGLARRPRGKQYAR